MTLGSNIQKMRKEASLSQEAFAEMFQVSRQTISNWENSKSYPNLETIIKISDSFHISLDVLLKEDLIMVKTFDHEVKSTRKYARALLDFTLHFHVSNLYCNIDLEDTYVMIIWQDENDFFASATSKKDEKVVGSTSEFKGNDFADMKKLGDELGLSEEEAGKIIEKGNELYQDFYAKK